VRSVAMARVVLICPQYNQQTNISPSLRGCPFIAIMSENSIALIRRPCDKISSSPNMMHVAHSNEAMWSSGAAACNTYSENREPTSLIRCSCFHGANSLDRRMLSRAASL
jgi:hypothetical protein